MSEILLTVVKHERWSRLLVATIRLPDGQTTQRDIEDHGNAAVVLPYDPVRRMAIVIRQFRMPIRYVGQDGNVMEAAAGRLDEADPEACTRREALEEIASAWDALNSSPKSGRCLRSPRNARISIWRPTPRATASTKAEG
jgi:hypothetical protein